MFFRARTRNFVDRLLVAALAAGSALLVAGHAWAACSSNLVICQAVCGQVSCDTWAGGASFDPAVLAPFTTEDLEMESVRANPGSHFEQVLREELRRRSSASTRASDPTEQ
jgi:hypothetical protein